MFTPDGSVVTPPGYLDVQYLRSRIRVHQLSDAGWETKEIAVALNLSPHQVLSYLKLHKPLLPWPRSGWIDEAICKQVDAELFGPTGKGNHNRDCKERAKKICAVCPVKKACLQTAIDSCENFGVWGGQDMSLYSYVFDEETGTVVVTVRGDDGTYQKVG